MPIRTFHSRLERLRKMKPAPLCKKVAWKILPHRTVQLIKRCYYLRLLRNWRWEKEPDLEVIQHLVRPGDHVIDIGANIGVYSQALSELVGPGGRVYSIEPFPATFDILCFNLRKLHLANVEPMNVAISDSESVVTMGLPYDPSGSETHYRAHIVDNHTSKNRKQIVKVQGTTIDSRFSAVSKEISFVKCDVEGHELACIKGAKKFLAKSQAAWLIEVSGDPDSKDSAAHAVLKRLNKEGYGTWWFDGARLRIRSIGDRSTNYFFLSDDHIAALKNRNPRLLLS